MRLKPRHYILIAALIAVALWNYARRQPAHTAAPAAVYKGETTPAWEAFDHAAALRNAPEAQFTPALEALRTQANSDSEPSAPDLRNCLMWLEYFRHSAPTAGGRPQNWAMLSTSHVQTCMAEHRDLGR